MCASLVLTVACQPQFNKSAKGASGENDQGGGVVRQRNPSEAFDPMAAGGGAKGTSASFVLSGVNIGYTVRPVGTSPSFTVKGGIDGQLGP
jgi:hypothetical protein